MDYLPLFVELKNRPVLVIGGGNIAARKIALLLRAGASVQVVAERLAPELQAWVTRSQVNWLAHHFAVEQLDHAMLVIAATDNTELN